MVHVAHPARGASMNYPMGEHLKQLVKTPNDLPAEAYNKR